MPSVQRPEETVRLILDQIHASFDPLSQEARVDLLEAVIESCEASAMRILEDQIRENLYDMPIC